MGRSVVRSIDATHGLCATVVVAACFGIGGCERGRVPERVLVPEGTHGWFQVCYARTGNPRLERRDGHVILDFTGGRQLLTESDFEKGWGADEFFFVSSGGQLTRIPMWPADEGVTLRNSTLVNRGHGWCEEFFVGDEHQLESMTNPFVGAR